MSRISSMARFRFVLDETAGISSITTLNSNNNNNDQKQDSNDKSNKKVCEAAVSFLEVIKNRGDPRRRSRSNGSRIDESLKQNFLLNQFVRVCIKNKYIFNFFI